MSEYIEVRSMQEVAYLLNVLFTNLNNLDRTYYDMFINPEPMDITLERYDENGVLTKVILPNRAKDRVTTYAGDGNPNGKQVASTGALYIDTSSTVLYYKGSGADAYGWYAIWSASNLVKGTDFLAPDGNGSKLTDLNAGSITGGTLSVQRGGTDTGSITGIVKGNGTNAFTSASDGIDYLGPSSFTGVIAYYPVAAIPVGWLYCDGAAYSRATYANLFRVIGTTYGAGNGSTTFNVPDLRGYFIRGWDSDRNFNEEELGAVGTHTHGLSGTTGAGTPHSHTKGSMRILGSVTGTSALAWNGSIEGAGALQVSGASSRSNAGSTGSAINKITLDTDGNSGIGWSGATSEENVHVHALSGTTDENNSGQENTVINKALVPMIKY